MTDAVQLPPGVRQSKLYSQYDFAYLARPQQRCPQCGDALGYRPGVEQKEGDPPLVRILAAMCPYCRVDWPVTGSGPSAGAGRTPPARRRAGPDPAGENRRRPRQ